MHISKKVGKWTTLGYLDHFNYIWHGRMLEESMSGMTKFKAPQVYEKLTSSWNAIRFQLEIKISWQSCILKHRFPKHTCWSNLPPFPGNSCGGAQQTVQVEETHILSLDSGML